MATSFCRLLLLQEIRNLPALQCREIGSGATKNARHFTDNFLVTVGDDP
jgi:hypothetical protein